MTSYPTHAPALSWPAPSVLHTLYRPGCGSSIHHLASILRATSDAQRVSERAHTRGRRVRARRRGGQCAEVEVGVMWGEAGEVGVVHEGGGMDGGPPSSTQQLHPAPPSSSTQQLHPAAPPSSSTQQLYPAAPPSSSTQQLYPAAGSTHTAPSIH